MAVLAFNTPLDDFLPVFSPDVGLATGSQHDLYATVTQPVGTNMRCLIKQRCACLEPNPELRVTNQSRKKHITSPINLQSRLLRDQKFPTNLACVLK